ncbi:MAG TPA: aminotransferase class V-fold PLP-dependent enzyme [Pedococcus sp.]|uniref:cysteine desulfurase family protein n=1 Tax=Pedococcus sp. TaxID=2860345 RepID=UPI002F95DB2B
MPDHPRDRAILDAASTRMHPVARETLLAAVDAGWADPRRLYAEARTARRLLDQATEVIADGLGVRASELAFAPSGEAAVRRAVAGALHSARRRGARVVATAVEHSAVLAPGRYRAAQGHDDALFAEVPVDHEGRVDLTALAAAVRVEGTVAAAVQHANGEVGTLQPLAEAHAECRAAGVPLVVDAQASLGRSRPPAHFDVLAGDAQSWGGPGGVGVLVVPERTRWALPGPAGEPGHGRGGDLPWVPLALAAAEAWQQGAAALDREGADATALVDDIRRCAAGVRDVEVVGHPTARLPHIVTFSALYCDGEAVVHELDRRGFAVASGSACTASTLEPSHVLAAMGVLTHGNVRVTLPLAAVSPGRADDVARFCTALPEVIADVRAQLGVERL